MKLLGIYTIKSNNYGNRLQNYATQFFLERHNFKVETIGFFSPEEKVLDFIKYHPQLGRMRCLIPCLLKLKDIYKYICKRDSSYHFSRFDKKIKYSKEYIGADVYSNGIGEFDAILVGSDQIWNTEFDMISVNSFLPFAHPCKIAWSASFGVDNIADNEEITRCLNSYKALSVREDAGAKIIKRLTGRDAVVLVDPTLLLTATQWRKISRKPKNIEDDYILTYFLSPKCDEAKDKLEQIKGNMKVYEILNAEDKIGDRVGPAEFLYLFDHAQIVLTDSFHACVFSFLFNKPFIVYDRNWDKSKMNSRLETFLGKFDLNRKYVGANVENDIWEHDYSIGYQQLEIERERSKVFLLNSIGDNI